MNGKEELAKADFETVEAMIGAYSEEAIRVAWRQHRKVLDFSEQSIDVLEEILAGQAASDLEYQTRTWGSYFGETLRQRLGGEWMLEQYPGLTSVIPALEIHGSKLFPSMKVYRRLTIGESENLPAFYRMVLSKFEEPTRHGQTGKPQTGKPQSGQPTNESGDGQAS